MSTSTIEADQEMLRARYGLDRNPWPRRVAVGLVLLALLAAGVLSAVAIARGAPIEGNALSWRAGDRSVAIDIELRGTSAEPVVCVVKAQDVRSTDIGYREFVFESSPLTQTIELPTLFRAASVSVLGCGRQGEQLRVPPPDFPPGVAIP